MYICLGTYYSSYYLISYFKKLQVSLYTDLHIQFLSSKVLKHPWNFNFLSKKVIIVFWWIFTNIVTFDSLVTWILKGNFVFNGTWFANFLISVSFSGIYSLHKVLCFKRKFLAIYNLEFFVLNMSPLPTYS